MGRVAEGWSSRKKRGVVYVRFTHAGTRYEVSTGERDPVRATEACAKIYAKTIGGEWQSIAQVKLGPTRPFDECLAEWTAAIESTHDEETVATYHWVVRTKFMPFFGSIDRITEASVADYCRARLKKVQACTVRKELAPLYNFLGWLKEQGIIARIPARHKLPDRATGVRSGRQRIEPVDISPETAHRIINSMPVWSSRFARGATKPFAVRPRFIVAWETSLRPETLSQLRVPQHYRKGASELRLTADIDKARFARSVPLTPSARAALDMVCPEHGLIFGRHTYWPYVKRAAKAAGLESSKATDFSAYDFRHGRAVDMLEASGNMPGTAFLLGHKLLTTTNKYIRPGRRHGDAVVKAMSKRALTGPIDGNQALQAIENNPLSRPLELDMVSNRRDQKGANSRRTKGQAGAKKGTTGPHYGPGAHLAATALGLAAMVGEWGAYDALWADELGIAKGGAK